MMWETPMAGEIVDINGPLVRARLPGVVNGEQVRIGRLGLTGEVIGREGEEALIQVYETTDGLRQAMRLMHLAAHCRWNWGRGCWGVFSMECSGRWTGWRTKRRSHPPGGAHTVPGSGSQVDLYSGAATQAGSVGGGRYSPGHGTGERDHHPQNPRAAGTEREAARPGG